MKKLLLILLLIFLIPLSVDAIISCPAGVSFCLDSPYISKANNYKGQLHAHTQNQRPAFNYGSDGWTSDNLPTPLATAYYNAGFNFMSITDHHNAGWSPYENTPNPGVDNFRFFYGEELSTTEGPHLGVVRFDNYPLTNLSIAAAIAEAASENAITIINHPNITGNSNWSVAELQTAVSAGVWGIEVYNQKVESVENTGNAENVYDSLLTADNYLFAVAADDCHDINELNGCEGEECPELQFNRAWVMVFADTMGSAAIYTSLKEGNFYSSTGATLSVSVSGATITATAGGSSTIEFIGTGGSVLKTESGVSSSSYNANGAEQYIRTKVTTGSNYAWSNPIYIVSPASFSFNGVTITGVTIQ